MKAHPQKVWALSARVLMISGTKFSVKDCLRCQGSIHHDPAASALNIMIMPLGLQTS